MTVYLVKKKKNRIYRSEELVPLILENEGLSGIIFKHGPSGQPLLVNQNCEKLPCPWHISVSDTKNWWAAVVTDSGDAGIDIEEVSRNVKETVVKKLHRLEQQYLDGLEAGSSEWTEEFFRIWTRKEAYSKFCSAGLSIGFGKFSVIDRTLDYERTVSCQGRPEGLMTPLQLPCGLAGSLCTDPSAGTPDIYVQLLANDGKPPVPALSAAMDMLSVRSVSASELSAKLQKKGYTKEESDEAAGEMAARGYVDDSAYAARQAMLSARSGKSERLIQRELSRKGLSKADIDSAIENLREESGESEQERALAQALKILPLPEEGEERPDEKKLAKLGRRLSALGYGPGIIYSILDKYR